MAGNLEVGKTYYLTPTNYSDKFTVIAMDGEACFVKFHKFGTHGISYNSCEYKEYKPPISVTVWYGVLYFPAFVRSPVIASSEAELREKAARICHNNPSWDKQLYGVTHTSFLLEPK